MRLLLLLATAACALATSHAQTPAPAGNRRPVTLAECIDLALGRNLDLQIQHLSAEIAQFELSGAYGAYVPTLTFEAKREREVAPYDFDPQKANPDFPYTLTTETLRPGLNGELPFGLSYDLYGNGGHKRGVTDFSSDPEGRDFLWGRRDTNNYFGETRLTARQHLLRDFWIDQNRLTILLGRKNVKISQAALRFLTMQTVVGVEVTYYDLVAAREEVRVQEQALQLRERFLAETRRRVQFGDLPPLEADQAESQLQQTMTALSVAREAYSALQNAMKALITDNFAEWAEVDLDPSDALSAAPVVVDKQASFQRALKNRPDLLEARLTVEKSDATVKFRFNQLLPSLDLVGGYGDSGVDTSFGGAVEEGSRFRNPDYHYGVVVSMPLSNIRERSSYKVSKAQRDVANLQLKKAEQAVLVQVSDWVNRVQSRYDQVVSTRKARIFAESALVAEEKKLQNGLSTSFVVLQLQEILTTSRMAEVKAQADFNKAMAQLAFAEGQTLEKHRILLDLK